MDQDDALPSSKLGTQAHWDSVYTREVSNYDELGDEGEVWFGEEAVQRMVDFLSKIAEGDVEQLAREQEDDGGRLQLPEAPSVLDVGTGNGHLLFALLDELDVPLTEADKMLGIDYSYPSVQLCERIARNKGSQAAAVRFLQLDFLKQHVALLEPGLLRGSTTGGWDIVCDKGTLDAIALSAKEAKEDGDAEKDPVAQYVASLAAITHAGSLFLITSCNFIEGELVRRFDECFAVFHVVPVPSFSFGGKKGSTTVTIAFRRR